MSNFIKVRELFYDRTEKKTKLVNNYLHVNRDHIVSISQSNDVEIDGVKYKYFNVQTSTSHFGCVSTDIEMLLGLNTEKWEE